MTLRKTKRGHSKVGLHLPTACPELSTLTLHARPAVFCSELVARLYIETGVLAQTNYADRYLPKDFSCDPHANMKDNYGTRKDGSQWNHGEEFKIVKNLPDEFFDASGKHKVWIVLANPVAHAT